MKRLLCAGLCCLPCLLSSCGLLNKMLQGPARTLRAAGRTITDAGDSSRISPPTEAVEAQAAAEVALRISTHR